MLVHAVVVLVPLAALAVVLHATWPAARARLGMVTPVLAVVATAFIPPTTAAGESLAAKVGGTARNPLLARHEQLGEQLLPWALGLSVVAIALWVWFRFDPLADRPTMHRAVSITLRMAALALAVGVVVMVIRVGDAGARATWSGIG
ncbi:hypothetical protein G9U51_12910 [Calidifontibacter sp. DB0510]|uniref:Uncharacterized protein n=2 Tax=Metallococcus carri TaxID=1656884 RepID=A0A967B6X2_9MICO|nr:hypothetical protein [Metallococcus carri]NOP38981.1 hypothetical protein [Calidifontibacter sp. DB2511S]